MKTTRLLGLFAAPLLVTACSGEVTPPAASAPPPSAIATASAPAPSASISASTTPQPAKVTAKAAVRYEGFATPESVLWDAESDRYLVSNINGRPTDTDNNGFISVLSPDGKVTNLKWIEGGKSGVKLDAPKGSVISKGVLYVADITTVRMFDARSGAPRGEIKIPDTTFLNDIAVGADGTVFVSDSGLTGGAKGLEPTGTDAVYEIDGGKVRPIRRSTDLGRPNGLAVTDKGLFVVTFGTGELYRLAPEGTKADAIKLPKGSLDGVIALPDDTFLISSWEGAAVYRGKASGPFEVVLSDQNAPADIGYDAKRRRVLVPHFLDGTVEGYDL